MNTSNVSESYDAELNKILVKESFFNEHHDQDDLETRKFSYAINILRLKGGKETSDKFIDLLIKPLRNQSNYLLIEYLVSLLKENQVEQSFKVFKILLSKTSRSMVMDLLFKAPKNKAKDICIGHLFKRCDAQAKYQFKFNDLIFFHRLCFENKLISKKVFASNVQKLLLSKCVQAEQEDFMKNIKKYLADDPNYNFRVIEWRIIESFQGLTLMLMRSTLVLAELGLKNESEAMFLKIYNYFFKKYKMNIFSYGCISYQQNGNIYHPRYFSEMPCFEEKTKYLVNRDQILHKPYNLNLINGGGLAGPSPYKFSELLIKFQYSNRIFNLLDQAYFQCATDKKNIYSFLPFITELNNSYPRKKLTKKLNDHLFSLNLGRHKPALLALPNEILKQNSVDPIKVRAHFIHSLEHGYNRSGLYYSDGSYWSEGFSYSKPPTINMQVFRFLYINGNSEIKYFLEEMALETYYKRNNGSTHFYDSGSKALIKSGKSINCFSSYRGQHLFLKELRVFLNESGDSFRESVNKKLTLGPYWKSHNICRIKRSFLKSANTLPSFINSFN